MNTTTKDLNSYIKKRKIEIKKCTKKKTGKYELPPKWTLIRSIKESETGCEKFHFETKVEFYTMIIDLSIIYGINLDDFSETIMAFESYQEKGIKGARFVGIYYEDKQFVLRAGIDSTEENATNIKMPESLISTY
jgi:hypothetical protein